MAMLGDEAWKDLDDRAIDLERRLLLQEAVEGEKRRGRRIILWRGILA